MRPKFSFLSAASSTILKPGGPLKCKMRLVKDARLSLPLTEVLVARLTSLLSDALCQSSPRPRQKHGRRLALLSRPNLNLNLCTLFCFVGHSSSCSPNFSNCSSPRESASVFADYLKSHFSVFHSKALRSRARGYFSKRRGT